MIGQFFFRLESRVTLRGLLSNFKVDKKFLTGIVVVAKHICLKKSVLIQKFIVGFCFQRLQAYSSSEGNSLWR